MLKNKQVVLLAIILAAAVIIRYIGRDFESGIPMLWLSVIYLSSYIMFSYTLFLMNGKKDMSSLS